MFHRIIFIFLLLPFVCLAALDLTSAEQTFLAEHPVVRTWYSDGSPALEFEENGKPTGFTIDYLNLLAETAGFTIDFGNSLHEWKDTEQAFRDRKIDFLTGTVAVDRYRDYALFSEPYFYFQRVYVVRKSAPDVTSPEDLSGLRVAVAESLPFVDVWRKNYPGIDFLSVSTTEEMIAAVADGRADATFLFKSSFDILTVRYGLSNLRIGGVEKRTEGLENCFRIAVRSDWPELCSILNKAMTAVPQQERDTLWRKWFGAVDAKPPIIWTDEERAYIKAHPVLRYSTLPDAPPLEYCNGNGECSGLTHEYVRRIEQQTGVRMEHVPSRNRTEKLDNLLTGRCDFLPTYAANNLPSNEVVCTDAYMKFPLVVATRIDVPYINSLHDCAGRRIGLVKRIEDVEGLKEKYPEIVFADCASVSDGLHELAQGSLFGLIGPQPVMAHQIQELYLGNLKITGTLEETLRLSAVVPAEEKQLRNILQKVLLSVSPEEQARMLNHWISIRFEQGFDYRLFWKILGGTGLVLLLLLIRYRMVARYSQKLKTLNDELGQSLAERDRIMSVISHDLRQPVYGYNQMLALLQSGEINPTSGDGQRVLTQSRQRGELAIESMENLLNWLNMPRGIRHPVLLSPHRLVEDSRELLTASLEHKHLRLENRIDPGIRIRADEQRLAAVLRNLINNAIKFSPSDAVIEADAEPVNNGVMLKICDHGIGMSAETVHKILSGGPVESTRGTGGERGSGMGLGLCRQFLQVIGSDLQIESVPGQGSCISFVLRNQALRTSC